MKKTIFLICILIAASSFAQDIPESRVPEVVKTSFTAMYPAATGVEWELENGKYEAEFKENKIETSVIFEATGKHLETEVEIAVTSLPESIINYVASNLNGKKINEATKITTSDGELKYEIGINNTDYLFDSNGSLLGSKTEKDDSDDKK